MIYFLFGEESFLLQEKLAAFREDFVKKNPLAGVETFLAKENDLNQVKKSFSLGGGLFSQKKLVIIKDIFELNSSEQEYLLELMEDVLNKKELEVVATFSGKPQKNRKLFKFFQKNTQVEEFGFLGSSEIGNWIDRKIQEKSNGKVWINFEVKKNLEISFGKDLWRLNGELEKLAAFKQEGEITKDDWEALCQELTEVKIFDFVDALGTKNKEKAVQMLSILMKNKEDAFYVFSMIVYQIRNLAKVDYCWRKGYQDQNAIASETGLHPFVVKKTLNQLRNFKLTEIKRIYIFCSELDFFVKTGKMEMRDALKDLVVRI
jgi:DNA polymerase-3 subunit delta